jgi:hypothetical protein
MREATSLIVEAPSVIIVSADVPEAFGVIVTLLINIWRLV